MLEEELLTTEFFVALVLILVPAYVANGMATIFSGGGPLDRGRLFIDGQRILGDGKTVRGTFGGLISGAVGGFLVILAFNLGGHTRLDFPHALFGVAVAGGAIIGDLFGAFVKRRLNIPRGAPAPGLDQLGFILFAFLFAYLFNWAVIIVQITLAVFVVAVTITPFAHLLGNFIGFKLGKKRVPW